MVDLNNQNVRVVDPILTTHVQGYRSPMEVGHLLFPEVTVFVAGGKVLEFGKEAFKSYAAGRAPGAATRRITFGYEGKPFALVQESLESPVPREWMRDASQVPGIDLGQRAVNLTMNVLKLNLERERAAIATDAGNYDANHKVTLAAGTKWSADTGKPLTDIDEAKDAVRASCGVRPNVGIMGPDAWTAAKNNPQVLARIYKDGDGQDFGPITLDQFRRVVGLEKLEVGEAITADDAGAFTDIWGNAMVLGYVPQGPSPQQEEPSYGYTYTMSGHPLVEEAYFDKNSKSWIYGVTYERAPVLTGITSGFLIDGPQ